MDYFVLNLSRPTWNQDEHFLGQMMGFCVAETRNLEMRQYQEAKVGVENLQFDYFEGSKESHVVSEETSQTALSECRDAFEELDVPHRLRESVCEMTTPLQGLVAN
jgi:hypothetical protein